MKNTQVYEWNDGLSKIVANIKKDALSLLTQANNRPILVVIAGGSCSGKTYLAKALSESLPPVSNLIISIDDYYKDIEDISLPRDEKNRVIYDHPDSYRASELMQTITNLQQGEKAWLPKYDMATNRLINPHGLELNPCPIIIVEGLFSIQFLKNIDNSLPVYLEVDYQTALDRRLERDVPRYNVSAGQVKQAFEERIWPQTVFSVGRQRDYADIIITI